MRQVMSGDGDALAAGRIPRRAARQGRDGRRDRRLPRRDPRGGAAAAGRPRGARHRRHRRRPLRHRQHLDDGGRRGRGIRCSRRQARQPGGELVVGLVATCSARSASTSRCRPRRSPRRCRAPGITFAFASAFHPGFRHAGPTRAELGVPTVFNFLGPLCNPARAEANAVGVAQLDRVPLITGRLPHARRDGARLPRRRRARRAHHDRPQPAVGGQPRRRPRARPRSARSRHPARRHRRPARRRPRAQRRDRAPRARRRAGRGARHRAAERRRGHRRVPAVPGRDAGAAARSSSGSPRRRTTRPRRSTAARPRAKLDDWVEVTRDLAA